MGRIVKITKGVQRNEEELEIPGGVRRLMAQGVDTRRLEMLDV